jgi:hypothetical protein
MPQQTEETHTVTDFGPRKVTIYIGTKKYEATQVRVSRGPDGPYADAFRFIFKPKGARRLRTFVEHSDHQTVVLDGWEHPEFDWLLRSFAEAPSVEMGPGVSVKTVSYTVGANNGEDKYEREFEAYVKGLDPDRILFDTRAASAAKM